MHLETSILNIIVLIVLVAVLIISTYTDLRYRKIFDVITFTAIGVILIIRVFHHPQGISMYLWGLLPAVLFYLAAWMSKGKAIGGGDIKLILFLGLTIGGIGTIMSIAYAFLTALLLAAVLYVAAGKKFSEYPMAPFFTVGVALFYTQPYWLVPIIY